MYIAGYLQVNKNGKVVIEKYSVASLSGHLS